MYESILNLSTWRQCWHREHLTLLEKLNLTGENGFHLWYKDNLQGEIYWLSSFSGLSELILFPSTSCRKTVKILSSPPQTPFIIVVYSFSFLTSYIWFDWRILQLLGWHIVIINHEKWRHCLTQYASLAQIGDGLSVVPAGEYRRRARAGDALSVGCRVFDRGQESRPDLIVGCGVSGATPDREKNKHSEHTLKTFLGKLTKGLCGFCGR